MFGFGEVSLWPEKCLSVNLSAVEGKQVAGAGVTDVPITIAELPTLFVAPNEHFEMSSGPNLSYTMSGAARSTIIYVHRSAAAQHCLWPMHSLESAWEPSRTPPWHLTPHALSLPSHSFFPLLSVTIGRVFVTQVQQEAGETVTKTHVKSCAFNGRVGGGVDERHLAGAPRNSMGAVSQVLVMGVSGAGGGSPGHPFTLCPFACVHSMVSPRRVPCASPPARVGRAH